LAFVIVDLALVLDLQCVDRMQANAIVISALSANRCGGVQRQRQQWRARR